MTAVEGREGFRGRAIVILILIGVAALTAFGVLAAFAPELRGRTDTGAHSLSSSAVGYRGAQLMLRELGVPAIVSRTRPGAQLMGASALVLTPEAGSARIDLSSFPTPLRTLIVLPKWTVTKDPVRAGFVRKAGFLPASAKAALLQSGSQGVEVAVRPGLAEHVLVSRGAPFAAGLRLPIGRLDGLQTISGPDWIPVLVDERGGAVLAVSRSNRSVYVLAEPDLLNNHGLSDLRRARAAMTILQMLSGEQGVVFDVTLNGFGRGRGLGRLMLEPPLLAATLCIAAAAGLLGWRAFTRFGAAALPRQAIAPGAAALVDNAAALIRTARKEPALAPEYAAVTLRLVAQAHGAAPADADGPDWLARAADRRALADPASLSTEAAAVRKPDQLMALARKLYQWRLEMTRERG